MYIGVTNNLTRRLTEHKEDSVGEKKHFTGKYNCIFLVYYEHFQDIKIAISREKEMKGWVRVKKNHLISNFNANWDFLNKDFD